MSWAFWKSGTPEEVVKALEEHSTSYSEGDQSKEEYDATLPHLVALVKENIGGTLDISANGHGMKNADGTYADKNCQVTIKRG